MMKTTSAKKLLKLTFVGLLASVGTISIVLKPKPTLGAERISFSVPVLGEFHLSVDSIEVFAKEGKITPEFNFYAKRLDQKSLTRLRQALQKQFNISHTTVYRLTKTPIVEDLLKQIGEVIYTHPERNGLYAIRSALILAAADSEGLTITNLMRHFPSQDIQVNSELIFSLLKEAGNFLAYNDSTIRAIAEQAKREGVKQQGVDFGKLPDLRQAGAYSFTKKTKTFEIKRVRQTRAGLAVDYNLKADIYFPEDLREPAPLVVFSHGFTSGRSNFNYLAEHLASHGYVIVAPEHIGSNSEFTEAVLQGEISLGVSPFEFRSRPLDITLLLNQIEKHSEFQGRINWKQVGIFGHSFGGETALVVSGAPVNHKRITQICEENRPSLNVSILLQCRAIYLPPGEYNLTDSRIKAVAVTNPVTSSILGPESMSKITIPTMILGGSEDFITPFIEEQAHPFLWLTNQHKYLGVMVGGAHNSTVSANKVTNLPKFLKGVRPDLSRNYLQAMSLAFFEVHLRDRSDYQTYLSSTYTQFISTKKLPLHLVKSLTPEKLELAYGKTPPIPPIPKSLVGASPRKTINILAEIQKTQTLKIAMRSDAAPFGYINSQQNLWTGYCADLADSLGQHLAHKLNIPTGIKVVKVASSLENRFKLVQENTVHLECGPNTIRTNHKGTIFSDLFFVSGTRFLVSNEAVPQIDFDNGLQGIKTGVLKESTTEQFLQETYPEAEVIYFQGAKGRIDGVKAIVGGKIDAFISDGVLLSGEIERQNLPRENYQLIPREPLTCDFYGLILPEGAPKWRNLINNFLRDEQHRKQRVKWLRDYYPQSVDDADYCLNR